jgi:hypothetical protein
MSIEAVSCDGRCGAHSTQLRSLTAIPSSNCSPSELLSLSSGSNLLGGIGVCDWSEAGSDLTEGETADALETICLSDGDPVAIFNSEAKAPLKKPLWSGVPAACLVIEEPVVTRGTSGADRTGPDGRELAAARARYKTLRKPLQGLKPLIHDKAGIIVDAAGSMRDAYSQEMGVRRHLHPGESRHAKRNQLQQ